MLTSVCYTYWQFVLAQGLIVGLGCACLFTPSMAIVPQYFTKKRNLALGLATSGASVGGIVYPIMFNQLLQRVGFGWSCRILAFTILATMMFAVALVRRRDKQSAAAAAKPSGALAAWKEPAYVMFTICSFFGFMGIYVPFYYIQLYSIDLRYVDPSLLGYIVSFLSVGSLVGRVVSSLGNNQHSIKLTTCSDTTIFSRHVRRADCRGNCNPRPGRHRLMLDSSHQPSSHNRILHLFRLLQRSLPSARPGRSGIYNYRHEHLWSTGGYAISPSIDWNLDRKSHRRRRTREGRLVSLAIILRRRVAYELGDGTWSKGISSMGKTP